MTNNTNGDYDLANQGGQTFRQELNGILEDIKTINAGSTEPAIKADWMLWADTSTSPPKLKVWNGGVWLVLGDLATQMNHASVTALTQSDFDKLNKDKKRPLFNRAIAGQYPPGSTVKPMLALGALDMGIVDSEYYLPCDCLLYTSPSPRD